MPLHSPPSHLWRSVAQGWRPWWQQYASVLSRIVAAVLGGYALSALFSLATLALPQRWFSPAEQVLWGMQLSFLVYAAAVVWVFAVRSATRAWLGLVAAALCLLPAVLLVLMKPTP